MATPYIIFLTCFTRQKLLQTAHERELAPDEVLLSQNDASHTGTSIFIVASGFCIAKHGQLTVPLYQVRARLFSGSH